MNFDTHITAYLSENVKRADRAVHRGAVIFVIAAIAFCLVGCGGSGGGSGQGTSVAVASNTWHQGGLVGTRQPTGDPTTWACDRTADDRAPCGNFILHQGHDCFDDCSPDGVNDSLVPRAEELAAAGFVVYEMQMPPLPHVGPVDRFYQPVLDLVGQISMTNQQPIFMAGLSGGGWTTTVSTAMDSRIVRAYSVSGDMPGYPTASRCQELAMTENPEFEQCNPPFPMEQLYAMAGVRLLHVYNFNEGGVFSGHTEYLGYPYVNDPVPEAHYMSEYAVAGIVADLRNYFHGLPTVSQTTARGQMFADAIYQEQSK